MYRIAFVLAATLLLTCCQKPQSASAGSVPRQLPSGNVKVSGPLLSYADVVQPVAAAVVTIRASRRVRAPQQFPFFDDPFFHQFFGNVTPRNPGQTERQSALGSGVIVRANGYVVTNFHVIDGAEDVKVDLSNRRTYSAKVVGSDQPSDLALLHISANDLPVLGLGDSDQVRVGDVCLAVGNPFGVGESVTAGIISAKGRSTDILGSGSFEDFLQTDAAINKGNSGGALVDTRGELIGINSQILSPNGVGNVGIGFAIPSNLVRNVMNQLIQKGNVRRGSLGVTIQPVTSEIAASLGLPDVRGVLVNEVKSGSPAKEAGLQEGDVILQFNGNDVTDSNALRNAVAAESPGTEVTLTIWRNGTQKQTRVRLGTLTAQTAEASRKQGQGEALGMTVEPMTPSLAEQLNLNRNTQGLAIDTVDPDGAAAQAGLQPGDVIQQVNRQPVRSPGDLRTALANSGNRPPLLLIDRGGQRIYVAVPPANG